MPSATIRFRRERSCSVDIPGNARCSSTNRRGPAARSRTISRVHLSPTRSSARASGDHWSYGWRLGGGTWEIGASRWTDLLPRSSLTQSQGGATGARANVRGLSHKFPAQRPFTGLMGEMILLEEWRRNPRGRRRTAIYRRAAAPVGRHVLAFLLGSLALAHLVAAGGLALLTLYRPMSDDQ